MAVPVCFTFWYTNDPSHQVCHALLLAEVKLGGSPSGNQENTLGAHHQSPQSPQALPGPSRNTPQSPLDAPFFSGVLSSPPQHPDSYSMLHFSSKPKNPKTSYSKTCSLAMHTILPGVLSMAHMQQSLSNLVGLNPQFSCHCSLRSSFPLHSQALTAFSSRSWFYMVGWLHPSQLVCEIGLPLKTLHLYSVFILQQGPWYTFSLSGIASPSCATISMVIHLKVTWFYWVVSSALWFSSLPQVVGRVDLSSFDFS